MLRTAMVAIVCLLLVWHVESLSGVQPSQSDGDASTEKELEKLQGTWYHVSREVAGKETAGESKDSLFVIRGNILVLKTRDEVSQVGMLKIVDSKSTPKKLDMTITDGPNEGMTILCVYQVDGDVLKYCGAVKTRPTSLTTAADDKEYTYLSIYKKLKR